MEFLVFQNDGWRFFLKEVAMPDGCVRVALQVYFGGIVRDLRRDDSLPGLRQGLPASIFVRDWASHPLRTQREKAMARQYLEE